MKLDESSLFTYRIDDTIELWVVLCKVSECDMLNQMQEECKIIGIEDINNPSIVRVPEISPLHKLVQPDDLSQ